MHAIREGTLSAGVPAIGTAGDGGTGEQVVLLDDGLNPCGQMSKLLVHNANTPLHLAFSCYVFDDGGRVLVTRRALGNATWPGVWTNAFCGHPAPHEPPEEALARRAREELSITVDQLHLAVPDFRYRAVDGGGIVENEYCPVWTCVTAVDPKPSPDEVVDWSWVTWESLVAITRRAPFLLSPWARLQIPLLARHGHPRKVQTA